MNFKSIIVCLLLIIGIFALTGCGLFNKSNNDPSVKPVEEETTNNPTFTIAGKTYELNHDNNHKDMYYKDNTTDCDQVGYENIKSLWLGNPNNATFFISMIYFENQTLEEALKDPTNYFNMSDKTINGISFKYFEYQDDMGKGHGYMCEYDNTLYMISITSNEDITSLENEFMNNVSFHK